MLNTFLHIIFLILYKLLNFLTFWYLTDIFGSGHLQQKNIQYNHKLKEINNILLIQNLIGTGEGQGNPPYKILSLAPWQCWIYHFIPSYLVWTRGFSKVTVETQHPSLKWKCLPMWTVSSALQDTEPARFLAVQV